MDEARSAVLARRLADSFPGRNVATGTLEEWATEFAKLPSDRGAAVLEWLRDNVETLPSVRQIRLAMARTRRSGNGSPEPSRSVSGCEFCGGNVKQGPDAGGRYDRARDTWYEAHLGCADARVPS